MNIILKNILAIIAGIVIGMIVNMALIISGSYLIPISDSMNPMNAKMWDIKYFIFPFLAHAIGTFSGAFITSKLSASFHIMLAIFIGIFFLLGGISMVFILPAPVWFIVADLFLAYIPMSWLGWRINNKKY